MPTAGYSIMAAQTNTSSEKNTHKALSAVAPRACRSAVFDREKGCASPARKGGRDGGGSSEMSRRGEKVARSAGQHDGLSQSLHMNS